MAFCSHCGAQLKDGAAFCVSCGTRVNGAPAGNAPAGNASYGSAPSSNAFYGNAPSGNTPYGNAAYGNAPANNAPANPYNAPPYGGYGYQAQPAAAPAKRSGKKFWIFGIGAVLLVGVAVLLILLLGGGGKKTELTMDTFIDKYIEAYKAYGSYEYYVDEDEDTFRAELRDDIDTLSGSPDDDNYFGASEELYVRIKRQDDPNIRMYFVVYPDESTAEEAFPKLEKELHELSGLDTNHKSEGSNAESLTFELSESNSSYVRVVRVGKTLLMINCSDDDTVVNKVFEIFGY